MRGSFLFFIAICFIFSLDTSAQYNEMLDSLLIEYKKQGNSKEKIGTLFYLFNATIYSKPSDAKKYAIEQLALSKKLNDKKGIGLANYNLGIYYANKSELDSATTKYEEALRQYTENSDTINRASTYSALSEIESVRGNYDRAINLKDSVIKIYSDKKDFYRLGVTQGQKGVIYMKKGSYKIALEQSLQSLKILDTINKPIRKADALSQVGDIEFELKNLQNALTYKKSALKIYEKYEDEVYQSITLDQIGEILSHQNRYKEALKVLDKSYKIATKLEIKNVQASVLANQGKIYNALNKNIEAKEVFQRSLQVYQKINDPKEIADNLTHLAILDKTPTEALQKMNQALKIADSIGAKKELANTYHIRSKIYEKLNNLALALQDYKSFKTINDSIFNISKSQQIEELRTIYETEKKEQEIVLQRNEIALLEEKAKVNNLQRILLASGLSLSLIIFGLGIYGLRQKIKRSKLEKEKVDAELAFKKKELTTHALHLAKKNEVLEGLKQKAEELKTSENGHSGYQQLIRTINFDLQDDNNWENFAKYFEEVHKDFNGNVKKKYPNVTSNELRLMALLKMNLSSKEIANILNISQEGIKKARYRLRKKLQITTDDSLQDVVLSL